ncbi:MAG: HAMP domain-containing histidine kinase [candidate division Zixibacteria bacterium]|nr:HAMP domain-containing histidine kinase [candidate division Zixibacteria bacterium]
MTNSKKIVAIIVTLIALSMAGLTILQVTLLGSTKTLKEQTFHNNVSNALSSVAKTIDTYEATIAAFEVAGDSLIDRNVNVYAQVLLRGKNDTIPQNMMVISNDTTFCSIDSGMKYKKLGVKSIILPDSACFIDTTVTSNIEMEQPHIIHLEHDLPDSGQLMFEINTDNDSIRVSFLEKVLDKLWYGESGTIQERINPELLDSVIESSLKLSGIDLDYVYSIKTEGVDSLWPKPAQFADELLGSEFKTRLFPLDFTAPQTELLLYFPAGDFYVWRQIGPMLFLTTLFLIILIFCFIYIVRILIKQRKTSSLMVDFINNMTHEFKTPISTVALASEAIVRPDIITDKEKVTKFSKMILDENSRMRHQAEKILQMATLEEGDFELKLTDVNIHNIINGALKSIALQIENKGGNVKCTLDADNYILKVDTDHISNIIFNLLDNAIKYSPDNPSITVRTKNVENYISITIDDKGRGMSPEDLKMVFKKYFRVSTGNIHDVKGFGIGLCYVKLMVEAHGGKISLKSKYEHGTSVEILLPADCQDGKINDA